MEPCNNETRNKIREQAARKEREDEQSIEGQVCNPVIKKWFKVMAQSRIQLVSIHFAVKDKSSGSACLVCYNFHIHYDNVEITLTLSLVTLTITPFVYISIITDFFLNGE